MTLPQRMWAGSLLESLSALKFYGCRTTGQEIHQDRAPNNGGTKSVPRGQPPRSLRTLLLMFPSIDCLYTNTNYLEVNFRVDVIKPGKTMEIPITFYPRESISYRELIPFEINGLSQQVVEIKGKGTEMKVRGVWEVSDWCPPPCPSQPRWPSGARTLPPLSTSPAPQPLCQRSAVPTERELSDQTPVNHRSYSTPNFTIAKDVGSEHRR